MTTKFQVSGVVQGVGFRWYVARHARGLGLRGYARNVPDGSVEVVVEGSEEAVVELERLLHSGPAQARVERVEKSLEPNLVPVGQKFDIL